MKTAEQLLDAGVEIPDDPVEIARLLDGAQASATTDAAAKPAETPDAPPADTPKPDALAADDDAAAKAAAAAAAAATTTTDDDEKGPPRGLLKAYRQQLHERDRRLETTEQEKAEALKKAEALEQEIAALKAKVDTGKESLQAAADTLGTGVKLDKLKPEDIEALRRDHSDDIVDVLLNYAKGYETLQEQVDRLTQERERTELEKLYDDIDEVPLLGVLRIAEGPEAEKRWERVVAYQKALKADPDFAGKSRGEVFAEVGRRMEGFLGKDLLKELLGDKAPAAPAKPATPATPASTAKQVIDEALATARKSAVPTSLSDIPAAGTAVAQDGQQRAEAMSYTDLQSLMDKWMAAGKNPDELIGKLLT